MLIEKNIVVKQLANGLTLLAENIDHVRSVTVQFLLPAGYRYEPADLPGSANCLAELITRGAGDRSHRQISDRLDYLGVDWNVGAGNASLYLAASAMNRTLKETLEIFADIIRRPHLSETEDLEATKALLLQELQSLEDAPDEIAQLELRKHFYPPPINRHQYGTEAGIQGITLERLQQYHQQRFTPDQAIVAVAGAVDPHFLSDQIEKLFGDWQGPSVEELSLQFEKKREYHPVIKPTQQTQVAMAFPTVRYDHPDYIKTRAMVGVLSGGMSARLFTEVREKRGLCYAIGASYDGNKYGAAVMIQAGTRPDRAQETLEVTLQQLQLLAQGISDEEIECVKASLKSTLIMQQESTMARATSLATDWHLLGRVRSFDEIQMLIDSIEARLTGEYCRDHDFQNLVLVTVGPTKLELS